VKKCPFWSYLFFLFLFSFFLHVVQERNSGIKTIMLSMGLTNEIYLVAQYISYLIENAFVMFFTSLFVALMVRLISMFLCVCLSLFLSLAPVTYFISKLLFEKVGLSFNEFRIWPQLTSKVPQRAGCVSKIFYWTLAYVLRVDFFVPLNQSLVFTS